MRIQPFVFDLLFYFAILLAGLDFTVSGFLVLRENSKPLKKPKLLGLQIIRVMQISDTPQKKNSLTFLMFNLRHMGIYTFVAGILIITASLIMVFDILL